MYDAAAPLLERCGRVLDLWGSTRLAASEYTSKKLVCLNDASAASWAGQAIVAFLLLNLCNST